MAALAEGIAANQTKPVLHGDNGATRKSTTVLAMLQWRRPRVSNDNAFAESAFGTAKYWSEYVRRGVKYWDQARSWAGEFVHWYNVAHFHSAESAKSVRTSGMPVKTTRFCLHDITCTLQHKPQTKVLDSQHPKLDTNRCRHPQP